MRPEIPVGEALREGVRLLEEGRVAVARLTAEVLLCHSLKRDRSYLYAHPEAILTEIEWIHYGRYLHERLQGKPTQYITGRQEFYGRDFRVSPAVLIPRPETEHVVETVLRLSPGARRILDVGTGSGAIAVTLTLECAGARVWATDISHAALEVARGNAAALGARVEFVECDLAAAIRGGSVEVVASNPPYVPEEDRSVIQVEVRDYEPEVALYGGREGVEIYRRLIPEAARVLAPGGWLVMELGYRSLDAVQGMLDERWKDVEVVADLAGLPRVLAARMGGDSGRRTRG